MKKMLPALVALLLAAAPSQGAHRMRVTFTGYNDVNRGALQNFPALVEFSGPSMPAFFDTAGAGDLRFYDEQSKPLPHEVDTVEPGKVLAWVLVPELEPDGSTFVFAVWGDDPSSLPAAPAATDVWAGDFKMVWHFNEPGGANVRDSTANGYDGWIHRAAGGPAGGVIGGAVDLSATEGGDRDNGIFLFDPAGIPVDGTWTISAWFQNLLSPEGDWRTLTRGPNQNHHVIVEHQTDKLGTYINGDPGFNWGTSAELPTVGGGVWRHVTAVAENGWTTFYVDGQKVGEGNFVCDVPVFAIGCYQGNDEPDLSSEMNPSQKFADYLDEVRVAVAARSADWIWAEFQNQKTPGVFAEVFPVDSSGVLFVAGEPAGVGDVEPAYGWHFNLAPNSNFTATASQLWTNLAETVIAAVTGWEVWTNSLEGGYALQSSDLGSGSHQCPYTHFGVEGRIVWHYAVTNWLEALPGTGGGVSSPGGWCGPAGTLPFEALPGTGYGFLKWTGDVPPEMARENPLHLPGDTPRTVTAVFMHAQHVADGEEADDENDGFSWATPKRSIAAAIAAMDQLPDGLALVAPGDYPVYERIEINGAVKIRGFSGNAADVDVYRATGNRIGLFRLDHPGAELAFMTLRDGWSNVNEDNGMTGGNIYIGFNGGTVADCVVKGGRAEEWGGGHHGGNIAISGAAGLVLRCVVKGGHGDYGGGGISMRAGRVEQCLVAENTNWNNLGAAIRMWGGGVVANCTLVGNYSHASGAVNAEAGRVVNCVIAYNGTHENPDAKGGSVFRDNGQRERFLHCLADVYINESCIFSPEGAGFADVVNLDYRLSPASPARGAGDAGAAGLVSETDLDANPVARFGAVDLGCWQYAGNGGALDAAFDAAPLNGAVPLAVVFTAAVENAVAPVSYFWDFGDGVTLTTNAASFTHTYVKPGAHTVSMTATDGAASAGMSRAAFVFAAADVVCVAEGVVSPPGPPFDTFDRALATLPEALAWAGDGTLILVSNGTHYAETLVLDRAVTLRGLTGRPEDASVLQTAPGGGRRSGPLVILDHPSARVENMVLRDGHNEADAYGGNVYINKHGGTVSNCVITAGWAHEWSSGIGDGGGVFMRGGLVTHCIVTGNKASGNGFNVGGGVKMLGGRLEHSLVGGNHVSDADINRNQAGGVNAVGGSVVNCTLVYNWAATCGGIIATGNARAVNTVAAYNASFQESSRPETAAWGGDAHCFIHCFTDTAAPIPGGNFTSPGGEMMANDFTLVPGSPLIGAAVDASLEVPAYSPPGVDLAGLPLQGLFGARDAGCYEFDFDQFIVDIKVSPGECFITNGTPVDITLTAVVGGTNGSDVLRFYWDFDEDMAPVETDLLEFVHPFTAGGLYTLTLTVSNLNENTAASISKTCLRLVPPILHVDWQSEAVKPNRGFGTWDNAAQDIRAALDFAVDGCEIVIREGDYLVPGERRYYPLDAAVSVEKAVRIRSEMNDPETVRIGPLPPGYTSLALHINHAAAHVGGVTLRDGWGNAHGDNVGKGVKIDKFGGTVSNCVIRANVTHSWGGVAYLNSPDALLTHCVITENGVCAGANVGGGSTEACIVEIGRAGGRVENCLVFGNETRNPDHGYYEDRPAVVVRMDNGTMRNCTLVANRGFEWGVFWFREQNPPHALAEHCVIAGNGEIPLVWFWYNYLNECTVDAAQEGHLNIPGYWEITSCRVGTPEQIFKDFDGGNYRLGPGSPAINAGPRLAEINFPVPSVDLDNRPRVLGGKLDHGCYEANAPGTLLLVR